MVEGITLGIITWASMLFSWWHLPESIKRFTAKHFLITDAITAISTWLFISSISKSLAAVVGTAITGLLMNVSMMGIAWWFFPTENK